MQKNILISLFLPIFLSIFISIFFIPTFNLYSSSTEFPNLSNPHSNSISNSFYWPTPGFSKITSYFGYRNAPTKGAGTYHGGIDIAAPENSAIISIDDGIVTFAGWYGANGYTVIIEHINNYKSIYGHVSPNFIVSVGDKISKGQLIAKIGPKYIEKKSYTTYIDKTGKYTNGATTRTTFTLCNNSKWKEIKPFRFFHIFK